MLIIRGGQDLAGERSPEEMQNHMQDWRVWMAGLAQQEKLIGGDPLYNEGKTFVGTDKKLIDRPLAEGKELIGGYLLIKAQHLDEACDIAQECPSFDFNASVEVREIAPKPWLSIGQ